jgi:hypothetical protein
VAVRLLADQVGLTGGLSRALTRRSFRPVHDRGRVLVDLAVLLADGGEAIADIDVLPHPRLMPMRRHTPLDPNSTRRPGDCVPVDQLLDAVLPHHPRLDRDGLARHGGRGRELLGRERPRLEQHPPSWGLRHPPQGIEQLCELRRLRLCRRSS